MKNTKFIVVIKSGEYLESHPVFCKKASSLQLVSAAKIAESIFTDGDDAQVFCVDSKFKTITQVSWNLLLPKLQAACIIYNS